MGYKERDVEVVSIEKDKYIVVACDSCGAIGLKPLDQVQVSPYIVGRLTARVALFEVLATEAKPIMVTVASCNEPHPTTEEIISGVKDELGSLDFQGIPVAISSEKNMTTSQTGLGLTIMGLCSGQKPRIATTLPGDDLYCLGIPKVGDEVCNHENPEIAQGKHILALLNYQGIHDIVPVGSRGIAKEAESLAKSIGSTFVAENQSGIDLAKSAGPSTCVIFTCAQGTRPPGFAGDITARIGRI